MRELAKIIGWMGIRMPRGNFHSRNRYHLTKSETREGGRVKLKGSNFLKKGKKMYTGRMGATFTAAR